MAVTSSDRIRRLSGRWWKRIHNLLLYPLLFIVITHYILAAKTDTPEPAIYLVLVILAYRHRRQQRSKEWGIPIKSGNAIMLIVFCCYYCNTHKWYGKWPSPAGSPLICRRPAVQFWYVSHSVHWISLPVTIPVDSVLSVPLSRPPFLIVGEIKVTERNWRGVNTSAGLFIIIKIQIAGFGENFTVYQNRMYIAIVVFHGAFLGHDGTVTP